MTDPNASSTNSTFSDVILEPEPEAMTVEMLVHYLEMERRRTIHRLRDLDRLLGRPQTIPERSR